MEVVTGFDKKKMHKKVLIFSYPLILTYVLGAQKNRLIETVLLSTHNMFWLRNKKNNFLVELESTSILDIYFILDTFLRDTNQGKELNKQSDLGLRCLSRTFW